MTIGRIVKSAHSTLTALARLSAGQGILPL